MLVPYLTWVTIAGALNFSVWRLNPDAATAWLFSLNRRGIRPGLIRIEGLLQARSQAQGLGEPGQHGLAVRGELVQFEPFAHQIDALAAGARVADVEQQGLGDGGRGAFVDARFPRFRHELDEPGQARHEAPEVNVVLDVPVHEAAEHLRGDPPQAF